MSNDRERTVVRTSIISIGSNIVLASFKAIVGVLANSIAIISDAVNNLSDALSSIITIIGTKLASKAPDKKHPYGHKRIEYLTSMIVSAIVLYAGITAGVESIKKIIHPEEASYTTPTMIVLVAGIIVKFVLGMYVKKKGKEVNSDALVASGSDAFNDAILSISVLASAIIYLLFHVSLEAYVGVILAGFIIKAGYEMIIDSINDILGTRIESDLSRKIKETIRKEPNVQGAFDLILNNYGPDTYQGSVHIEVPDTLTVAEVDRISRRITATIMKEFGVVLHTVGIYSINTRDKHILNIQKQIQDVVFAHEGVIQMHGFFFDEEDKYCSFDIVVSFSVPDREALYGQILDELKLKFKDVTFDINLDIDISD